MYKFHKQLLIITVGCSVISFLIAAYLFLTESISTGFYTSRTGNLHEGNVSVYSAFAFGVLFAIFALNFYSKVKNEKIDYDKNNDLDSPF